MTASFGVGFRQTGWQFDVIYRPHKLLMIYCYSLDTHTHTHKQRNLKTSSPMLPLITENNASQVHVESGWLSISKSEID